MENWQYLLSRKNNNTLPHALLFVGEAASTAKLTFAQKFAQLLLCERAGNEACSNCSSCHWFQAGTHPDYLLVQAETSGKIIKVDQIRELVEEFSKTSQCNGYQIAVIEPAEAMNIAAANALLKTLEEPLGKVIIILISEHPSLLPATIRSRCQQLIFEESKIEESAQYWQFAEDLLQLCTQQNLALKIAATYMNLDPKQVLPVLLRLLNDLVRVKFTQNVEFFAYSNKIKLLQEIAKNFTAEKLFQLHQKIVNVLQLFYKNINLNQQLVLEDLFMDVAGI